MKQDKTTQDKGLHTPGEWYTVQHSDESWGIHVKGEEIPKDLQGMIIGVIGHAGLTWNTITSKANAALIASAPQLKEENEKLRNDVKVLRGKNGFWLKLNEGEDDEQITTLVDYLAAFDEDMDDDFIKVINLLPGQSYQYGADNIKRIDATEALNQTKQD